MSEQIIEHVTERNYAKCIARNMKPYKVMLKERTVLQFEGHGWTVLPPFATQAALQRWERSAETRATMIPANGLSHMAGSPINARVVRLERRYGQHSIVVKEAPCWNHVATIVPPDLVSELIKMADDDTTIIDITTESLATLLQEAVLSSFCPQNKERDTMKQTKVETLNAQPATLGDDQTLVEICATAGDNSAVAAALRAKAVFPPDKEPMFIQIAVEDLEEHPKALAFWPDTATRRESVAAVQASVLVLGVRNPLVVCTRGNGGWWVIDGCTRLAAARAARLETVPCRVIDASEAEIDDEIFVSNMDRTRFSSGMRVMRYLERNLAIVLETAKVNADPAKSGAKGGRGIKGWSHDQPYSPNSIAKRLNVSDKDVRGGIELLQCKYDNKTVRRTRDTRCLVESTEEERAGIDRAYARVMDGMPLRRWLPAAAGHVATEGKAKAPTDYGNVAARTLISLGTVFAYWGEIPEISQEDFAKGFKKVLAMAPTDVLLAVRKIASMLPPL